MALVRAAVGGHGRGVAAAVSPARPLRRRIALLLWGLTALLLLTAAAMAAGQLRAGAVEARVTGGSGPALVAVERLDRTFADERAALSGYLLSGQAALLEPYRR